MTDDQTTNVEVPDPPGGASGHTPAIEGRAPCPAPTKTGRACRWPPMTGSAYCYQHRPDMAERRRANRSKAARMRVKWHTAEGQIRYAKRIHAEIEAGTLSRRRGETLLRAMRVVASVQRRLDRERQQERKLAAKAGRVRIEVKLPAWLTAMQQPPPTQ